MAHWFYSQHFAVEKDFCLEDLWGDFVKVQNDSVGLSIYGNRFYLVHARFGLLIITFGRPGRIDWWRGECEWVPGVKNEELV